MTAAAKGLHGGAFTGFARYGDGWIVTNPQFGYTLIALRNADGSVRENELSSISEVDWAYAFRVDPETGHVLYPMYSSGMVEVDQLTGVKDRWAPRVHLELYPIGFVGRDSVVFADDDYGDRVFLGKPDGAIEIIRGLDEAWGASRVKGWISASTYPKSVDPFTGVFDPFTGNVAWSGRGLHATIFSPDGDHVLGIDYSWQPVELAILDSGSGTTRTHVKFSGEARRLTVWGTAWEDNEHVLAVVKDRRT